MHICECEEHKMEKNKEKNPRCFFDLPQWDLALYQEGKKVTQVYFLACFKLLQNHILTAVSLCPSLQSKCIFSNQ